MDRDEWNRRYETEPLLWKTDPGPFLGGEIGTLAPGLALDVGAGEGRAALWLAERGWRVTAVDFSDVGLARGRQRAEAAGLDGAVDWVCADLVGYEPPPEAFDLVLMLFVHLDPEHRRLLLRRTAAALAPGGTLVVVGYEMTGQSVGRLGPMDPALLFSSSDVVGELDGLRIERADRLEIDDAVDTIVRAVKLRPVPHPGSSRG